MLTIDHEPYHGPERRQAASVSERLFAATLDEIDHGLLLMKDESTVAHVNRVARAELRGDHPFVLNGDQLDARDARDAEPLRAAVAAAIERGMRRTLTVGRAPGPSLSVTVVPLLEGDADAPAAALLMFAKRRAGGRLPFGLAATAIDAVEADPLNFAAIGGCRHPCRIEVTKPARIAPIRPPH